MKRDALKTASFFFTGCWARFIEAGYCAWKK